MKKLIEKLCHSTERMLVTVSSSGTPCTSNVTTEPSPTMWKSGSHHASVSSVSARQTSSRGASMVISSS